MVFRIHTHFPLPFMQTVLYYGPGGCGKTTAVWSQCIGRSVYRVPHTPLGRPLFDGYDGETDLIIEDPDIWLSPLQLLDVLDRNPIHGFLTSYAGLITPAWERVWITSIKPIEEWFPRTSQNYLTMLQRRIPASHIHRIPALVRTAPPSDSSSEPNPLSIQGQYEPMSPLSLPPPSLRPRGSNYLCYTFFPYSLHCCKHIKRSVCYYE